MDMHLNSDQINAKIAELNKELEIIKKKKQELDDAKRKEVNPIYLYEIKPVKLRKNDSFYFIFDETIVMYNISQTCTNANEVREAGHPSWNYQSGSMNYLFNKATELLVTSVGGGTLILRGGDTKRWRNVSAFLVNNPFGGDITSIMILGGD